MWIVRWETQSGHHGAMWRSRAKDLGNGSYLASLPATLRGIHALAHVQLWWTASVRSEHFLLHDCAAWRSRIRERDSWRGAPLHRRGASLQPVAFAASDLRHASPAGQAV